MSDQEPSPESGRLFVGVWPSAEVVDMLAALPREPSELRWTVREQWHVTLRFLGRAEIAPAIAALEHLRHEPACTATVAGDAVRLGRGAVVLRVDGLVPLAARTSRAFDGIGRPPEERPFVGHLTLARLKGAGRVPLPSLRVDASWRVRTVCLMRSHLGRGGARYETVATVDLAVT
jgi:RNA 2',3'-cyclic 3'-phosphodiesterase